MCVNIEFKTESVIISANQNKMPCVISENENENEAVCNIVDSRILK